MGPIILLFAFFSLCSDPSAATSFEMIFQNSPHSFKNDFAEFKGPIPNLTEFTSCHWEKLSYLAARSNTIWSYCHHERVDRPSLNCIQLYSMGDLASYYKNIIHFSLIRRLQYIFTSGIFWLSYVDIMFMILNKLN